MVIDYPNSSKAKKYYLCLSFERSYTVPAARIAGAMGGNENRNENDEEEEEEGVVSMISR